MNLLVLNCGSATVKFKLFVYKDGELEEIAFGVREIKKKENYFPVIKEIISSLPKPPHVVAHRVVHGGDFFHEPVIIDQDVIDKIESMSKWAPLHNPPTLLGIKAASITNVPQAAVFDTAFHQTIPEHASTYPLPLDLQNKHGIKKHGFHGVSYKYVSSMFTKLAKKINPSLIILHLGGGASCAAIKNGKCVDTSMGATPLEGLVMGTRGGDLDPAIIIKLIRDGMSLDEVEEILWRKSGLLGLANDSNLRNLLARDDDQAKLAVKIFCYRIQKYIGSYLAVLGRVDGIIFTGGIGENSVEIRKKVLAPLFDLGVVVDKIKNENGDFKISTDKSNPHVYIIPTNEELMIAREAARLF